MTLAYQSFTAVLLIYASLFLSGVYYCLSVFWCAVARMSELLVKLGKSGSEIREMLVQVYVFLREEQVSLTKRHQDSQQRVELKKTLKKFVQLCVKIVG
jgi:phosphomannomutase